MTDTDHIVWRESRAPDAASLHITKEGAIAINVGGNIIAKPLREWHKLAQPAAAAADEIAEMMGDYEGEISSDEFDLKWAHRLDVSPGRGDTLEQIQGLARAAAYKARDELYVLREGAAVPEEQPIAHDLLDAARRHVEDVAQKGGSYGNGELFMAIGAYMAAWRAAQAAPKEQA